MTTVESRYHISKVDVPFARILFSLLYIILAFRKVTKKRAKKEISEKIQKILCTNGVSLPHRSS